MTGTRSASTITQKPCCHHSLHGWYSEWCMSCCARGHLGWVGVSKNIVSALQQVQDVPEGDTRCCCCEWNLVMALSILHPTWLLSSFLRVHSPVTLVSCQPLLPSILLSAHKWAEISCQLRLIFSLPSCINSSEMLIQMQLNSKAYCLTLFPVNPQKALWGRDDQIKMLSRRWCSRREKWFEVVSVPWYFY